MTATPALHEAWLDDDPDTFLAVLRDACEHNETNCWIYPRTNWAGYPKAHFGTSTIRVHRYAWMIANGYSTLPAEYSIHHICANRACVNPEHLQLVTQAENNAEMLQRKAYKTRIARLEDELRRLDPSNILLDEAA